MVKLLIVLATLALLCAGVWFFFFNKSEEDKVRERMLSFIEVMEKSAEDSNLSEAIRSQQIPNYLAPEFKITEVHRLVNDTYSPTEFASTVLRFTASCSVIDIDCYNMEVVITGETTAEVSFEGTATAKLKGSSESMREARDIVFSFEKIDDKWLITTAAARKVMTK